MTPTPTKGKIFLLQESATLQVMTEQPYTSEDLLQTLLEKYPDLLAGDQINQSAPRRWLLVSREFGVPDEAEGTDRWSLDHLFLDQDAIPTLVEVKRSSDTRIRREVVGQMLDYAANAVVYWPVATIRAKFEATCEAQDKDAAALINDLVGAEPDGAATADTFWEQVKTNLQAGRIRLVFVADQIPAELRRIVEFLNSHMDPTEVLAVEIRQFVGQGIQTLVPRVIGLTAGAEQRKTSAPAIRERKQWDEATFIAALGERRNGSEAQTAQRILRWSEENGLRIRWGQGVRDGSFFLMSDQNGVSHYTIAVDTGGLVWTQFNNMRTRPPFDSEELRQELLRRFNALDGVNLPPDTITTSRTFRLAVLEDEAALAHLLDTLAWIVRCVKSA